MKTDLLACLVMLVACGPGPGAVASSTTNTEKAISTTAPVSSGSPSKVTAHEAPAWTVINTMPAWWNVYDEAFASESVSGEERRAMFRDKLVEAYPEVFAESVLSLDPTAPFDLDPRMAPFAWSTTSSH